MNHYFVVSFGNSSGLTFLYVKNESDNFSHIYIMMIIQKQYIVRKVKLDVWFNT